MFTFVELCFPKRSFTRVFAFFSPFIFIIHPFVFSSIKSRKGYFPGIKYQENENPELLANSFPDKEQKTTAIKKIFVEPERRKQVLASDSDGE